MSWKEIALHIVIASRKFDILASQIFRAEIQPNRTDTGHCHCHGLCVTIICTAYLFEFTYLFMLVPFNCKSTNYSSLFHAFTFLYSSCACVCSYLILLRIVNSLRCVSELRNELHQNKCLIAIDVQLFVCEHQHINAVSHVCLKQFSLEFSISFSFLCGCEVATVVD